MTTGVACRLSVREPERFSPAARCACGTGHLRWALCAAALQSQLIPDVLLPERFRAVLAPSAPRSLRSGVSPPGILALERVIIPEAAAPRPAATARPCRRPRSRACLRPGGRAGIIGAQAIRARKRPTA